MTEKQPRTAAEILADWRALGAEADDLLLFRGEGWQEQSARRAERRADLLEEAAQLDEFPREISQWLVGYAVSAEREHVEYMRRPR